MALLQGPLCLLGCLLGRLAPRTLLTIGWKSEAQRFGLCSGGGQWGLLGPVGPSYLQTWESLPLGQEERKEDHVRGPVRHWHGGPGVFPS